MALFGISCHFVSCGLQSIPNDLFEAATIDGASKLQQIRYIVLPGIRRVVEIVFSFNIRGALQVFDIPFLVTQGGPGNAERSPLPFLRSMQLLSLIATVLASAMAIMLMVMIIVFSYLQNLFIREKGDRIKMSITGKVLYYLLFSIIILVIFVPLAMVVIASFKTSPELAATSPFKLPSHLNFTNFITALKKADMLLGLMNSFIITVTSVVVNAVLGSMTAFILNRFDFRFKKIIFILFIVASVVPTYTTEIARFQIIKSIGLYNTLYAPLIIYAGTDLMQIFIFAVY